MASQPEGTVLSLRDDLLLLCDKMALQGEDFVFFSVNVWTEKIFCCGSKYGQEYLTERSSIVHSFLEFCKERMPTSLHNSAPQTNHLPSDSEQCTVTSSSSSEVTSQRSGIKGQNSGVNDQGGMDDIICIDSDDEDGEFEELTSTSVPEIPEVLKIKTEPFTEEGVVEPVVMETEDTTVPRQDNTVFNMSNVSDVEKQFTDISEHNIGVKGHITGGSPMHEETTTGNQEGNDVRGNVAKEMQATSPIKGGLQMCQTCGESFFSFHALEHHLNLHKTRREVKKSYMRQHAGDKPYKCHECDKQFDREGALLSHLNLHNCGIISNNSHDNSLQSNQASCSEQKKKPLNLLKKRKERLNLLKKKKNMLKDKKDSSTCSKSNSKHEVEHFGFKCDVCSKKFNSYYFLYQHKKSHKKDGMDKVVKSRKNEEETGKASNVKSKKKGKGPTNPKCYNCPHVARSFFDLKVHARIHLREEYLKCGICGKETAHVGAMRNHWKTHVKGSRSNYFKDGKLNKHIIIKCFTCRVCSKAFKTKQELFKHKLNHVTKKKTFKNEKMDKKSVDGAVECQICHKWFRNAEFLKTHETEHQSGHETEHQLGHKSEHQSGRKTEQQSGHKTEQQSGLQVYKCSICEKKFNDLCYIREHLSQKHQIGRRTYKKFVAVFYESKEKSLSCPSCGQMFLSRKVFDSHKCKKVEVKGCKCSNCYKTFKELSELKVHSMKCSLSSRPYQCKTCGKRCKTIGHIRQHAAVHSKVDNSKSEINDSFKGDNSSSFTNVEKSTVQGKSVDNEQFPCHTCSKVFLSSKGRSIHSKLVHRKLTTHEGASTSEVTDRSNDSENKTTTKVLYLCRLCDCSFEDNQKLKRHWKIHESEDKKPFQCRVCLKSFYNTQVLRWHESTHEQNKSRHCKICNIKIFNSATFKIHMQLHK